MVNNPLVRPAISWGGWHHEWGQCVSPLRSTMNQQNRINFTMIPNAAPTEVETSGCAFLDLWVKTRRFRSNTFSPPNCWSTAKSKANKPTQKIHPKIQVFVSLHPTQNWYWGTNRPSPSINLAQLLFSAGHEFPALNPPKTQLEAMQSHRGCGEIPPKIHSEKKNVVISGVF